MEAKAYTLHNKLQWVVLIVCSQVIGDNWQRLVRVKSRRVKFTINWVTLPKMAKSVLSGA